ncbi:MAG: hypothetical protein RIE56_13370 [Amphiplicatus sp.]|uniref:hypothetical protein n=1 Tax=Pelagibacterium sp. TaxID=1967288 RepID=UPI0032EE17EE
MQRPSLAPRFPDYASQCQHVLEADFGMLMRTFRSTGRDVKTSLAAKVALADQYERHIDARPLFAASPAEARNEA